MIKAMIKIKAKLKLYKGKGKRKTPFLSGYRPLFGFSTETKTSGQINLLNQKEIKPGEDEIVEIVFLNREYLGYNFGVGKTARFFEGEEPLGEVEIIELL